MASGRASMRHQRGWVGLIVLLVALAIVALLAKNALTQYGLLTGAGGPAAGRDPTPAAVAGTDVSAPTSAPAAPIAPMERARAIEGMVKQQADDRAQQIDRGAR